MRSKIPLPLGRYKVTLEWESEDGTSTIKTEHHLMVHDEPEAAYIQEYTDIHGDDVKVATLPDAPRFELSLSGALLAMPNETGDRTFGRIVSTSRGVEIGAEE